MVDKAIVDELFGVMIDDFDIAVEVFAEVADVFVVGVVDGMRSGAPFGAGAPVTTSS